MKLTADYNLGILYPELAKEWHPTKNGKLTPFKVTPSSNKKVWWKCSKGHEWPATINNRKNGDGCALCSGRRALEDNNLAVLNPALAKEWHPTKNGKLKPNQVVPGSSKRVWWKCKKGHEWPAVVNSRAKQKCGCPYCSGRIATEENNLAVLNPELVKEWHPTKNGKLTPFKVTPSSGKRVWWKCSKGHEWRTAVYNRSIGRTKCRYCNPPTSKLEIRTYCEMKTIFNTILWRKKVDNVECDILLPQQKIGIEIDGYPWHQGNELKDLQKSEFFNKKGILLIHVRDRRLNTISQRDIFYKNRERHILIIRRILKNLIKNQLLSIDEKKKVSKYLESNKFQNTHEFRKLVSDISKVDTKKSLFALFPDLVKEWNYERNKPLIPQNFPPYSHVIVWWKCNKGHEWPAEIRSRTSGNSCPICSGKKASMKNNLAVLNPELAKEWHPSKNKGLTPFQVTEKSGKKVWWKCSKGHEWPATIKNRSSGTGCPDCYEEKRGYILKKALLKKRRKNLTENIL